MLKLPTEVRLRIFEYLLPSESLGFLPPEIYGDSDEYSDIGESLGCDLDDWNMSLLLVNRQIYQEASSTLYGKAVFQVDIDDESLSVPGSRFMVGPVSPNNNPHGQGWKAQLEILPYRKIKVFHVEITAPAMLDGPHRISTPNWEKLLHDVHDNVHRLASLFKEVNRIRNLSVAVSFVTHSPLIESVVAPAKWLLEPLWALRNVQRLDIKDIQLHVEPDRTTRKMILIGTKSAGADNVSLQASRMEWSAHVKEKEALFPSTDVAPSVPPKILEMYKRIDDAAVALRDVVPYGGEWG
ncbi:hypothetical protein H2199_008256 [Coniosporium tulheliwenetii]|uniref:Uncharacterized protein n=1 Tax=Coniosporium tulheliwenetii TaxID=3383036 RepID=A0ACC2YL81_9PEZI|nr:hypothetical protein H2199_008256 [Cladosporium sp. JES 115]